MPGHQPSFVNHVPMADAASLHLDPHLSWARRGISRSTISKLRAGSRNLCRLHCRYRDRCACHNCLPRYLEDDFYVNRNCAPRRHGENGARTEALLAVHGWSPIAHVGSSVPACSATMYAAYQQGQSAFRSPVRFSCWPCASSARRSALRQVAHRPVRGRHRPTRPGSRVVISCSSQPLPSGSLNDTNDP